MRYAAMALILVFINLAAAAQSDTDIANAVMNELAQNANIDIRAIAVTAQNGIVTLRGTVPAPPVREDAARIAGAMRDVRGVVNELDVAPPPRSDADLLNDIQRAIAHDPILNDYQVEPLVYQGEVTLIGVVDSPEEWDALRAVVADVPGVAGIVNMVAVNPPPPLTDADIAGAVRDTMRVDPLIHSETININVDGGTVILYGSVWNEQEKMQAIADAWVPGVVAVDATDLDIAGWARKPEEHVYPKLVLTDDIIAETVEEAIHRDPRVASISLNAKFDDGVVTLRGTVNNVAAREAAEQQAWSVVGVRGVVNRLEIAPSGYVADDYIKAQISDAIIRHPEINRYYVNIQVINGMVYLDGTVNNDRERVIATDLASAVNGVRGVINNIQTAPPIVAAVPPVAPVPPPKAVAPVALKNDTAIEMEVRRRMFSSPNVDGSRIQVKVATGTAILSGVVGSQAERQAAEQLAYLSGASWVNNLIEVKTEMAMQTPTPAPAPPQPEVVVVPPKAPPETQPVPAPAPENGAVPRQQ